MNPRYTAYLKTTKEPTNWGFMIFINEMVRKYGDLYLTKGRDGYYHINNQDKFTTFIENEVNQRITNV